MLTLATDKNVDLCITYLKQTIPEQMRKFVAVYLKYAQESAKKFESLKTGEERLKVRNLKSFDSLKSLSFDKFLYALDKDMYIDFINEINNIKNSTSGVWIDENWKTEDVNALTGNIGIKNCSLDYKFMIHPATGIRRLAQTNRPDQVPLIKVDPTCFLSSTQKKNPPVANNKLYYDYDKSPDFIPRIHNVNLDVIVDIESLFDVINFLVFCEINQPKGWIGGYDILNIITKIEGYEYKNQIIDNVSDILSKRVFYSASITLLATVTKLTSVTKSDFFSEIADDILNSCRNTLMDNYDSDGNDAGVNEGTILRNTAINIRDLLNSLAIWNDNKPFNSNPALILAKTIEYLFSLKYCTYNYIKVPINNLKHKTLELTPKLAKYQASLISKENALDLNLAFEGGVAYNRALDFKKNSFFFLPIETLKIDGTYAVNKRMYDCGKDFLDCFAKFTIIKKRMGDTAEINVKDGSNVDRIGKTYDDYKTYLKKVYTEVKAKLNILSERVITISKGRNRFSFLESTHGSAPDSKINNINSIIYGLTAEAVPIQDVNYWDDEYYMLNPDASLMDETDSDSNSPKPWENRSANRTISDINEIFKYTNTKESKYLSHTSVGTEMQEVKYANLIDSWMKFNQVIGFDVFDLPYRNIRINLTMVLKDSFSYITTSISEMAPTVDSYDPNGRFADENGNENRSLWYGWRNPNGDEILKEDTSIFSLEDLENKIDEIEGKEEEEDESGEENLFGMFTDSIYGPVGNDISVHELALQAQEALDPSILQDEKYVAHREKFKELKNRYDSIIASRF